jgi:hypothetical protein
VTPYSKSQRNRFLTVKIEAVFSTEAMFYQVTEWQIQEGSNLHSHCRQDLKLRLKGLATGWLKGIRFPSDSRILIVS